MANPIIATAVKTIKPSIDVLYEDETCCVLNKPAGVLIVAANPKEGLTFTQKVNRAGICPQELFPAHRLDRDTTGVIIYAKGKDNQERLMSLFKERKVTKVYVAFAHGHIKQSKGSIRFPIKDIFQQRFRKNLPPQDALTHYKVLSYYKHFTEVEVMPVTGRTNQIRIHFSQIGHPLVGEDKYAFRRDFALRFRRTALHAQMVQWPSLVNQKLISVQVPLPEDMEKFKIVNG